MAKKTIPPQESTSSAKQEARPSKPSGRAPSPRAAKAAKAPASRLNGQPAAIPAPGDKPAKARATRPAAAKKAAPRQTAHSMPNPQEIALRAYFISERRQANGETGCPTEDWLAAERELVEETRKNGKGRSAR